jgi:putative SbcD/Mre11-related phosphoesterase
MDLLKGVEIVDLCLYFKKEKILVLGDVHIGLEEAMNKQGIFIPRFQFKEVMERLNKIFSKIKPALIIFNGDIKHEFGTISDAEWLDTLRLLDYLLEFSKVVMVKGNHDTILGPIAKKRGVEIKDYCVVGDTYICHGHRIPDKNDADFKKAKNLVIGHEHPTVGLKDGPRVELYKCFLKGKYGSKNLIVMPSFNLVTEGTDILQENLLSPFLSDISDFEVIVAGDKLYEFGSVRSLLRKLK